MRTVPSRHRLAGMQHLLHLQPTDCSVAHPAAIAAGYEWGFVHTALSTQAETFTALGNRPLADMTFRSFGPPPSPLQRGVPRLLLLPRLLPFARSAAIATRQVGVKAGCALLCPLLPCRLRVAASAGDRLAEGAAAGQGTAFGPPPSAPPLLTRRLQGGHSAMRSTAARRSPPARPCEHVRGSTASSCPPAGHTVVTGPAHRQWGQGRDCRSHPCQLPALLLPVCPLCMQAHDAFHATAGAGDAVQRSMRRHRPLAASGLCPRLQLPHL